MDELGLISPVSSVSVVPEPPSPDVWKRRPTADTTEKYPNTKYLKINGQADVRVETALDGSNEGHGKTEPEPVKSKKSRSREEWADKKEFMLSCIGLSVNLHHLWRFPYLCYKHTGGEMHAFIQVTWACMRALVHHP